MPPVSTLHDHPREDGMLIETRLYFIYYLFPIMIIDVDMIVDNIAWMLQHIAFLIFVNISLWR